MQYSAQLGHKFFALTDHEMTGGWIKAEEYEAEIQKEYPEFKLIRGNEIYLCRNDLSAESVQPNERYYHFILLALDEVGAHQLYELSTRAWKRSFVSKGIKRTPTLYSDIEDIIGKSPGHVIGSTACRGSAIGVQIINYKNLYDQRRYNEANQLRQQIINWCLYLQKIFGKDYFYLEFQPSFDEEQIYINKMMIEISKQTNIPYVISTDSHYKSLDKQKIHSAYLNSQDGERETSQFYASTYLMNTEELENYFSYLSREELDLAYSNIDKINESCERYSLKKPLKIPSLIWKEPKIKNIPKKYYKLIPNLEIFENSSFNGDKILIQHIISKIESDARLQTQDIYDEVNSELETVWKSSEVNKAHWSAYFLNLQNIIDVIWNAGSVVGPARGSGGGFLLLYLLDIIQINKNWETVQLYPWRFLNPDRVSILDIDTDVSGLRRQQILQAFRDIYGENRVANVATYGTEKSKSAILSAARGIGINNDEAQYISSLIPSDRGQTRTLSECYYGDEEKDFKPVSEFKRLMDSEEYKELWKVAQEIEGIICRIGIHAGGVIFVDEAFNNSCALMKAPDGTIITQYELHDSEKCSLIKMDLLSVEAIDKIQICIELLQKDGYIDKNLSLREAYEQAIGIYNIERNDPKMWEMLWNHQIISLFQMEQQSGIQGIDLIKPKSVDELAVLNSVIRLMPPTPDDERPLDKWKRFRENINLWVKEMQDYGLTKEEIDWLSHHSAITDGICESQEGLMQLLQEPQLGGNTLAFSDKVRKSIAKKNGSLYDECEKEYYINAKNKNCSEKLVKYVWSVLFASQRGYSFCRAHTTVYSLIGLQEMNLAYKYPIIYWNCANLIVNAGGDLESGQTNYDKIAQALGNTIKAGIKISLIDINKSDLGFKPDVENNTILYGMKALSNVGDELIQTIIANRPYTSPSEFLEKVNPNKSAMLSLIKSGAFDNMMDRVECMKWYIWEVCGKKSNITLQNLAGLISYGLIPEEESYELARRVFEFNKYLKAICKYKGNYKLDERAIDFLTEIEKDDLIQSDLILSATDWDRVYQGYMDIFRVWISKNKAEILENYNQALFNETWAHYASGNISAWEMEVMCFYYHEHEMAHVQNSLYGISDFKKLSEQPIVEKSFEKGGRTINMFQLTKIGGTCIAKDKAKSTISLLTTSGVVTVKFSKTFFPMFDKQISVVGVDGKKKVLEKSWFNRGSMLIVNGVRNGDTFLAKKYSSTPGHLLYQITKVNEDGTLELVSERIGEE